MAYGSKLNPALTSERQLIVNAFKVFPDGSNAPTVQSDVTGVTVTRVSAGLFQVTVKQGLVQLYTDFGVQLTLSKNAGADLGVEQATAFSPSTGAFRFRLATAAGVETDLAANANNFVSVVVLGKRTAAA